MAKEKTYGVGFLKSTPDTSETAILCDWKEVTNARVVELKDAYYRGSTFSGTFEVADKADPFFEGHDGLRVEIKLHWYGRRLKTRWARALVGSKRPKIKTGYSGKVGRNLGEP
jgi:hypothetical protein